jgi:phosphorylcholine metabolism protein LicD
MEVDRSVYDPEKMVESIIIVSKLLNSYNIKHWLNFGAMLGIVRENRLLPWDNDAEINCWKEDIDCEQFVEITQSLNKLGFDAYYRHLSVYRAFYINL